MARKSFPIELVLLVYMYIQPMFGFNLKYYVPILLILTTLTLTREKARVYTPLILVLVALSCLPESVYVTGLKIVLFIIVGIITVKVRYFQIKDKFHMHQLHSKQTPKLVGYKDSTIGTVPVAIFYPTTQRSKKRVKWFVGGQKTLKNSEEVLDVMLQKEGKTPFWFFKFVSSYMDTYHLNAHPDTPLQQKDDYNLVFISHGLAGTRHAHTAFAQWWASRGYIVVAVHHDQFGRIKEPLKHSDPEQRVKNSFQFRNNSLESRVRQFKSVVVSVLNEDCLDPLFGFKVRINKFQFVGHSFGCPTILQTAAQLQSTAAYQKLQGIITLDPWIFPLNETSYIDFKRPYLNIKSQTFVDNVQKAQPRSFLGKKNHRMRDLNKSKMVDLTINGMDHIHQSDSIFVSGTVLEMIKMSRGDGQLFSQLNTFIIYLFQIGKTEQQIVQESNRLARRAKRLTDDIVIAK